MTSRTFSVFSVLLLLLVSCDREVIEPSQEPEPPLPEVELAYSFFVAGHAYGAPGVDNVGVHPPFREYFDRLNAEPEMALGVLTGDIVLFGSDQNWDEIDQDMALLDMPVHFAVGNHDMSDRALYEARYGQTYGSFQEGGDLFILLDPNLDEWNISGDQLVFLQELLNSTAGQVDHIFVFFHQLMWWEDDNRFANVVLNSLQGRADSINFWTEVEPLFSNLNTPTVMFAGDVGAFSSGSEFMYDTYDNITLIASGMGSEVRDNLIITDVYLDGTVDYRLIHLNGDDVNSLGRLQDYVLP